ncbi:MAG: phosphatidylglycerol lysyltransferase domain-containing protein [Muribaculaceae bacterium]|nr:phosphatidylglycerol lysyltransferase domain-containing protein [Muribaculaceae bacterium]
MAITVALRHCNNQTATDSKACEPRFRPVEFRDIPMLTDFFNRYPSRSCDFSIGGVLMWADYFDYRIAVQDDSLLICGTDPTSGDKLFYAPCGPMENKRFMQLVNGYCRNNRKAGAILMPFESVPDSPVTALDYENECATCWKEYLYDIDRFTSFSGRKMEKKRNHLNFFINNYSPFETEIISGKSVAELIAFTIAFDASHTDNPLAAYECGQVIEVLRRFDDYPFFGLAIRIDGEVAGYTFGEKSGDTFFVHVEKGNIDFRGIYQALASGLAREVRSRFPDVRYLNREEDMGDESLRRSKESYHPTLFVNKRIVRCEK